MSPDPAMNQSIEVGVGPRGGAPGFLGAQVARHIHFFQFVVDEVSDVPGEVVVSSRPRGGGGREGWKEYGMRIVDEGVVKRRRREKEEEERRRR